MTTQELGLIKDIIESAVTKAVTPLNEELRKIRAIAQTTLKEGREKPTVIQEQRTFQQLPNLNRPLDGAKGSILKNSNQLNEEVASLMRTSPGGDMLPMGEVSEDLMISMLNGFM